MNNRSTSLKKKKNAIWVEKMSKRARYVDILYREKEQREWVLLLVWFFEGNTHKTLSNSKFYVVSSFSFLLKVGCEKHNESVGASSVLNYRSNQQSQRMRLMSTSISLSISRIKKFRMHFRLNSSLYVCIRRLKRRRRNTFFFQFLIIIRWFYIEIFLPNQDESSSPLWYPKSE